MGSDDPMAILAAQLTGNALQKPRQKTPYNLWGPENRCFVDPVFKERVREGNVPARQQAALRSSLYRELFNELPEEEQREWTQRAEQEHSEALSKFNKSLKQLPSEKPEDRQRYAPIRQHPIPNVSDVNFYFYSELSNASLDLFSPSSTFWQITAGGRFRSLWGGRSWRMVDDCT